MSRKSKQAVVWFRFKFADTAAGRMQIQRDADKLFHLPCVSERRSFAKTMVTPITNFLRDRFARPFLEVE